MNAPQNNTEHIFSAIRREVAEEFKALTLLFEVNETCDVTEALHSKRLEINEHPAGTALLQAPKPSPDSTALFHVYGPGLRTKKRLFNLGTKEQCLFLGVISKQSLSFYEEETFAAQYLGYAYVFKALYGYFHESGKLKPEIDEPGEPDAAQKRVDLLRMNLMADAFAAMLMEHKGVKGAIQRLVKRYCELSVKSTVNMFPEYHPLPMAIDGLQVVFKDLKDDTPPKMGQLEHFMMMAIEIGQTYDDLSLQQWTRFCLGTQDMVWADYSANEILSAAIYGSDDPYIRSNAYICAESLNTNPVPLKNTDMYNPFSDDETNERSHLRLCRVTFIEAINSVNHNDDSKIFLDKALKQTKKLLQGHPLGWCAPALIEAENAYRLFQEDPKREEDTIQNAFHGACSTVKWFDLKRFNRFVIAQKRRGISLSLKDVITLIDRTPHYAQYRSAFELMAQSEAMKPEAEEPPKSPFGHSKQNTEEETADTESESTEENEAENKEEATDDVPAASSDDLVIEPESSEENPS